MEKIEKFLSTQDIMRFFSAKMIVLIKYY